jgi:hypothetical protein
MTMAKICGWKALDTKVLAVATVGPVEDWSAYIGAVEGENHEEEAKKVAAEGSKLSYALAKIIFPNQAIHYEWRD